MSNVTSIAPSSVASRRELLAKALRQAAEDAAVCPLSFAQQRLWFLEQLEPGCCLYNLATAVGVTGPLDRQALERAFLAVIARHEVLRSRFLNQEEGPVQIVSENTDFQLGEADLSTLPEPHREAQLRELVRREVALRFDLSSQLPIRARLVHVLPDSHLLVTVMHHIVSDEWSLRVFYRELFAFYQEFATGEPTAISELPIQYADYAAWQREWASGPAQDKQLAFWKGHLEGCTSVTELPSDRPRPAVPSFRGGVERRDLPTSLTAALKDLAARERATLFMVLLTGLHALVHRYTGREDSVIATPIAGRTRPETEGLIGFFVNTLPLRARIPGGTSFRELLSQVRETTLAAYANQDVPFDRIVEVLRPERSLSHMPFTRVVFAHQSGPAGKIYCGKLVVEPIDVDSENAKFDCTITAQETEHGLRLACEYSAALYEPETVQSLLAHFENLLSGVVREPGSRVAQLSLLSEAERHQLLVDWNKTSTGYPRQATIHQLFESQAETNPDAVAITYGLNTLTYSELNGRANQLARHLRGAGVGPDLTVGVCLHRSVEMVVALLGVLKAGGAYVPIDPSYPRERLEFMLEDSHARILLTQQSLLSSFAGEGLKVICLDADWERVASEDRHNPANVNGADDLAYVMYTSGSTGRPKGVAVPHRAVTRLVLNTNYIQLSTSERIGQLANISFDAATFEIWGSLLNGGQLVGITHDVALSPKEFAQELREKQVTSIFITTALFSQVVSEDPGAFSTLQTVITGGEVLDLKWARNVLSAHPPKRLLNAYGPTENTTFTTCHLIRDIPAQATSVPIGRPISNTTVYILDPHMNPVPVGVPGELYAGGDGLARGYWNRPELTAQRFVPNPFDPGTNLYRTGDLARLHRDGSIEFLGRIDEQVKIRGFRVELGEIESVLKQHPGVRDCAVALSGTNTASRRLIGYVVPEDTAIPNSSQLRAFLGSKLPEYMLPSAFVQIPSLPLTPNGKLNRKALPEPDQARPELEKKYASPRDAVEERLTRIWEQVLNLHPIGIEDKFFDLGGHSLLAVKVTAQVEKAFGKKLRLATIFQAPTISQLAAIIREETREPAGTSSSLVEIHSSGSQAPLFLVHGAGGGMFWGYVNLAQRLKQPVYGFKSRGLDGLAEWNSIEEMAAHYVADMRRRQPVGPYRLGGYCFGGVVAFEMARQLEAAGEKVSMLALMNCAPPNSSYTRIPWSPHWALRLVRNTVYWSGYFRSWKPAQRREFFRWKWRVFRNKWFRHGGGPVNGFYQVDVRNLVDLSSYTPEQQKVWEAHIMALVHYQPKQYEGRVHLFRSPGHPLWCSFQDDYGWGEFARGGVEVTIVEGAHERILEEPCVQSLASALSRRLNPGEEASAEEAVPLSRMAMLKGVVARASLFWLGVEGETWEVIGPAIEHQGLQLSTLFQNLAVLSSAAPKTLNGSSAFEHPANGVISGVPARKAMALNGPEKGLPRGSCEIEITGPVAERLRQLCATEEVPARLSLLAAAKVLIFRYALADGELRPIPRSRSTDADQVTLTCAVNELVLHTPLRGDMTFRRVLHDLHESAHSTRADVVASGAIPLLRLVFTPANGQPAPETSDLILEFQENEAGYAARISFNPVYFTEVSARRVLEHFARLVEGLAEEPDLHVGAVPLVSLEERRKVMHDWNHSTADYDIHKSYIVHFRESVRAHPDVIAAEYKGRQITYAELDRESNRLAHYLRSLGVAPEVKVGVCLDRSLELLTTLLGIWKAGGAYVPLDPAYPQERLAFMLSDSAATILVGREPLVRNLSSGAARLVLLDSAEVRGDLERCGADSLPCEVSGDTLAYVIYTSGSTGTPKGVEIVHRSLLNHNFAVADAYGLRPGERVLQFTPISFDISVEEIFPTLLKGGTIVFRTDDVLASTHRFLEFVDRQKITVLNLPTAYWHELVEALQTCTVPAVLRLVVIGGEKASNVAFRRWKNIVKGKVRLINTYGPTEATVIATMYEGRDSEDVLPIGRPLPNVQTLVLDEHLQPVPVGMVGELYIGGEGVSRGYYNRPELNAQRFILNPFQTSIPCARLYRTGDLVRLREDGNLEFAGRVDNQVKFRGYRIELGEIEAALRSHASVKEAAATIREDKPGDKRLVAYYVLRESASGNTRGLRQFLARKLPEYMVPNTYVPMSAFPLTPAGKIDRAGLPEPGNNRPEMDQAYVAPRTALEQVVAQIWGEVLGVNEVGVFDSFFDLGGHSLLATQVMSRVREALQVDLSLASLFESPTVAAFCESVSANTQPVLPWAKIVRTPRLPLTGSQHRVWFLDQFDPGQSAYSLPLLLRLSGQLDLPALQRSIAALVGRHEALRAVFPYESGEPVQYLCEPTHIHLRVRDFTAVEDPNKERLALEAAALEASKSSLTSEPVFRPWLFQISTDQALLLLVLHDIVADHASLRALYHDLVRLYEGFSAGKIPELPPVKVRYSEALDRWRRSEEHPDAQSLQYWRRTLSGAPEVLNIPADRSRPPYRRDTGARLQFELGAELSAQLAATARNCNTEPAPLLLAAFATLLHRYTGSADLVLGTTFSWREDGTEDSVGPFSNPLPLRFELAAPLTFGELLGRTSELLREGERHANISLATLVNHVQVPRNASHTPLFQALIQVARHSEISTQDAGGLRMEPVPLDVGTARTDLALRIARAGDSWRGIIEYSTDLFDASRVSRMVSHFQVLLRSALALPATPLSKLALLPEDEMKLVVSTWNDTDVSFPRHQTLTSLIEDQVRRTPEAQALVDGTFRLSYRELDAKAYSIAASLQARGVGSGALVGICLERSWKMVAAILGVLRSGAAYVPLDPAYPQERLATIVRSSQAALIISEAAVRERLPQADAVLLMLDEDVWQAGPSTDCGPGVPTDLAYVIYTSGSTGVPKGVAITHQNAVAFVTWAKRAFTSSELKGVLASTSICFDLSIFEMFVPLSSGGTVILARNALALAELPAREEVTLVNTVPSAMQELLRAKAVPRSVRVINLAGEPLTTDLVEKIYSATAVDKLYDLYGPSETTTYSTGSVRRSGEPATIGRPLDNEQVYVLDPLRQPVPIGVPGELWISGAGVAAGYLHQPQLTQDRFVANPFRPETRMYRTGDLARWREDGNLEYLGRLDHQVKIRGFRIELGEIEATLRRTEGVKDAVVVARQYGAGDQRLVAYVVCALPRHDAPEILRAALRTSLPEYMVPTAFVLLGGLPLTPNGKIDRKALPEPRWESSSARQTNVEPRTPVETRLLAIYREVLAAPGIGIQDNFFDAGGHSLLAIRVVSRIREELKVSLPLFALFDSPTVESLAALLESPADGGSQLPVPPLERVPRDMPLPVSFVQERLWFLDQFQPGSDAYNVPAAFRLRGRLNVEALGRAYQALVRRHEALRTRFVYRDGSLYQEFLEPQALRLETLKLQDVTEQGVDSWAESQARQPFDLSNGPLVRATLASLGPEEHLLAVVMHHTISDGWSVGLFFQELEALYSAFVANQSDYNLPELPVQYADFAQWQRSAMRGPLLDQELAFWKHSLAGAPQSTDLPLDRIPDGSTVQAGRYVLRLSEELRQAIATFAQKEGLTPFIILLGALKVTIHRWSGQKDLVTGTVVAGRNRQDLENVLGCFMNFLPLRYKLRPGTSGGELLADLRKVVLEAQNHQDCPFEKIVESVNPERKGDQNPLYNVALLLQNFPSDMFTGDQLDVVPLPVTVSAPLLDLRLEAEETPAGFVVRCEYKQDRFEPSTIEALMDSFELALTALVKEPAAGLEKVAVSPALLEQATRARSAANRHDLCVVSNFTAEPVEEPLRVCAREAGVAVDIHFAGYNQVFQELLAPSGLLASNSRGANIVLLRLQDWTRGGLESNGSSPADTLRRNACEFVDAVRGAASRGPTPYLIYICPSAPEFLSSAENASLVREVEQDVVNALAGVPGLYIFPTARLHELYPVQDYSDPASDELGNVPYTPVFFSALATAIARHFHALKRPAYKVIALDCDNTLWSGVCGEDGAAGIRLDSCRVALQEFMLAQQQAGMLLVLCTKNNLEDVEEVFTRRTDMPLRREHISGWAVNWSPKSENLKQLAQTLNLGLDSFIFLDDNPVECAEVEAACPGALTLQLPEDPSQIPGFLHRCWAFDHLKVTEEDRRRAEMYRQNQAREALRQEAPSLADFIAGLNLQASIEDLRPEQTSRVAQLTQRTNQFNATTRRRTEAEIEQLQPHAKILCVSVRDRFGDYGLVGVVVCHERESSLDVDTFLLSCRVLGRGVEHRMLAVLGDLARSRKLNWVDVHYVRSAKNKPAWDFLENVGAPFKQPLNGGYIFRFPAGYASEVEFNPQASEQPSAPSAEKPAPILAENSGPVIPRFSRCRAIAQDTVDLNAWHARLNRSSGARAINSATYVAPRTQIERQLCELWQNLLKVERVGITDNFFDLGGHSLMAVRLFSEVGQLTGEKLPLVTLFQAPTIEQLAHLLHPNKDTNRSLLVPIQPRGSKPPLFLVHGAGGDVLWGYANLAAHLGDEQPVYGIKSRGQSGLDEFTTLEEMAACYIAEIQSFQPTGPYYLGGYCFGGNVAYEMARQLQSTGEAVGLVALLDSAPTNAGYETITWWEPSFTPRFARNLGYWLDDFRRLKPQERRRFFSRKLRALLRKVRHKFGTRRTELVDLEDVIDTGHFPSSELRLWQAHLEALVRHTDQPYDGPVTLLRTRGQPLLCSLKEDFCWRKVCPRLELKQVPGSHEEIFMEPHVQSLARQLTACLEEARLRAPNSRPQLSFQP